MKIARGRQCRRLAARFEKEDVERGQVIAKPGSITPHKSSWRGLCVEQEEGGRHTPFFTNYRLQFYFRTDVTARPSCRRAWKWSCLINISIEVELITPIAMEKTIRFAIREGGKLWCRSRQQILIAGVLLGLAHALTEKGRARVQRKQEQETDASANW